MAILEFDLTRYFEGYRFVSIMAKHRRISQKVTRVTIARNLEIPVTSYRRFEEDINFKNTAIIMKAAKYFNINTQVDYDLVYTVADDFNEFYTCAYFGDIEYQEKMYLKLMGNFELCKDSILLIPMNLAKLVQLISTFQYGKNQGEIQSIITLLYDFYDDMIETHKVLLNSYMCGYLTYKNHKDEMEKLTFDTLKMVKNNEVLKPIMLYQFAFNYLQLHDWSTSLYYCLEAQDGLVELNNYNRLLYLKYYKSINFYNLRHYEECISTTNKIINWTSFNQQEKLEYSCLLLKGYSLLRVGQLENSKKVIEALYDRNKNKGELVVLLLYLYYRLKDQQCFLKQTKFIEQLRNEKMLYTGYYNIAKYIVFLNNKERSDTLKKIYKELEKDFAELSFCNLVDILKEEFNTLIG